MSQCKIALYACVFGFLDELQIISETECRILSLLEVYYGGVCTEFVDFWKRRRKSWKKNRLINTNEYSVISSETWRSRLLLAIAHCLLAVNICAVTISRRQRIRLVLKKFKNPIKKKSSALNANVFFFFSIPKFIFHFDIVRKLRPASTISARGACPGSPLSIGRDVAHVLLKCTHLGAIVHDRPPRELVSLLISRAVPTRCTLCAEKTC